MSADRWTQAVRHQLGLGRLVPLGGPQDGCWLAESAARSALRRTAQSVPGVRLESLRIELAYPEGSYESVVSPPPSALPPGPLRIVAECAAAPDEPLPTAASRLRAALTRAASDGLGLAVDQVDLRVTALLDDGAQAQPALVDAEADVVDSRQATGDSDEERAGQAALSVPGWRGLPVRWAAWGVRCTSGSVPRARPRCRAAMCGSNWPCRAGGGRSTWRETCGRRSPRPCRIIRQWPFW